MEALGLPDGTRAEDALRESEERLRLAIEAGKLVAWDIDLLTQQVTCSSTATEVCGICCGSVAEFLSRVYPKDRRLVKARILSAATGCNVPPFEHRMIGPDGQVRWLHSRGETRSGARERPTRFIGISINITPRKKIEAELRQKQDQLIQADKLASIGQLASGVAHELKNPLNNIGLFIGNVLDDLTGLRMPPSSPDVLIKQLQAAAEQVRKASEIITHLRSFARKASVEHTAVSINEVLHSSLFLLREQFRLEEVEVCFEPCQGTPMVQGSTVQLEQVFVNLLSNAGDAVRTATQKHIQLTCAVQEGTVEVKVQDSGIGIPPEVLPRIFEPFFTTKKTGEGTGLGLSITSSIVTDHDGSIQVQSLPDNGTTFIVRLPLAEKI
jgi:C4-dicarboxylate-specific signal transduction histidine kinase